jgi:hypothetical protein
MRALQEFPVPVLAPIKGGVWRTVCLGSRKDGDGHRAQREQQIDAHQLAYGIQGCRRHWPGGRVAMQSQSGINDAVGEGENTGHGQTKTGHEVPAKRCRLEAGLGKHREAADQDQGHGIGGDPEKALERGDPEGQTLWWVKNLGGGGTKTEVGEKHSAHPGDDAKEMHKDQDGSEHVVESLSEPAGGLSPDGSRVARRRERGRAAEPNMDRGRPSEREKTGRSTVRAGAGPGTGSAPGGGQAVEQQQDFGGKAVVESRRVGERRAALAGDDGLQRGDEGRQPGGWVGQAGELREPRVGGSGFNSEQQMSNFGSPLSTVGVSLASVAAVSEVRVACLKVGSSIRVSAAAISPPSRR